MKWKPSEILCFKFAEEGASVPVLLRKIFSKGYGIYILKNIFDYLWLNKKKRWFPRFLPSFFKFGFRLAASTSNLLEFPPIIRLINRLVKSFLNEKN